MRIIQGREAFKFYLPKKVNIKKEITKRLTNAEVGEILNQIGLNFNLTRTAMYETENFCFSFEKTNINEWIVTIKPL